MIRMMGTTPQHPGCSNGHSIGLQQVDVRGQSESQTYRNIFFWVVATLKYFVFFHLSKNGGEDEAILT